MVVTNIKPFLVPYTATSGSFAGIPATGPQSVRRHKHETRSETIEFSPVLLDVLGVIPREAPRTQPSLVSSIFKYPDLVIDVQMDPKIFAAMMGEKNSSGKEGAYLYLSADDLRPPSSSQGFEDAAKIFLEAASDASRAAGLQNISIVPDVTKTDWLALSAAKNNIAFALAEDLYIQYARREVVQHIDAGDDSLEILRWYELEILPTLEQIHNFASMLIKSPDEKDVFHDIRNRLSSMISGVPMFLRLGKLELVRSSCQPPDGSLKSILQHLQSRFALHASITQTGMEGLRLSPAVDLEKFTAILVNLVGNAADHPAEGKTVTTVKLVYRDGMLIVDDKGSGMTPEALENLQNGVRIHDGVIIAAEDETNEHGFGWAIIRRNAKSLGIELDMDSELGRGTTVVLTLPDGFTEPDPLEYSLSGRADVSQIKELVAQLSQLRRFEILKEMNEVADKILNQHMAQAFNIIVDSNSVMRFQAYIREVGVRYQALVNMLAEGLSPTGQRVRDAQSNAQLLIKYFQ